MAQEFVIKSQDIENKINQLLPSQGGFQAGVDFSASTMVVPIVDLTETAEGSNVRADLQTALSLNDVTNFEVINATETIINTTGYYRVFGVSTLRSAASVGFKLTDGTTTKDIYQAAAIGILDFDFTVFLPAGNSLIATTSANDCFLFGCTKQIADINGNLTQPT